MAGDKLNLKVSSWYKSNGASPDAPVSPLTDLVTALVSGVSNVVGATHGGNFTTDLQNSGIITTDATDFLSNRTYTSGKPKAYLNWVLLDEQFKYVQGGSGALQVPAETAFGTAPNQQVYALIKSNLPVTRNGYLYVFVSNETPNINVFFDNLQVTHIRGPILEETHYYPFGLTMAGISSKAMNFGDPQNKIKFQNQELQNKEFDDGSGLELYQFKYRVDDPQIGRFWQIDPLADKYVYNSTYAFSENHVTSDVELEGLEKFPFQYLWRSAGITSSTDPKQFVKDVGKEALKPKAWIEGSVAAGQTVVPLVLTTIMTGGFGDGAVLSAETKGLQTTTTEASTTVNLSERANEIHSTLPIKTQDFNTTAVASATTSDGKSVTLVGSNEQSLRPAQRAALNPGEIAVSGDGKAHAEVRVINYANENGMTVNAVAASRPICPGCATAIQNAGAIPASPLKLDPIRPAVDATYVKPPPLINIPIKQ
jgi:RHS repeat-associated protein